jgi:hypothetical protein
MRISTPSRRVSLARFTLPALALLLLFAPRSARTQCITNSDCMWPVGCGYTGSTGVPLPIPAPPVVIRSLVLIDLPGCTAVPPSGTFIVDSFFDVFFDLSLDNGATFSPKHASGHGHVQLVPTTPPGANPAIFNTEMLQLDISGGNLPGGVMLRESPSRASTGQAQDQSLGGGQFHIDSFFDVFTELSLDGGVSWHPSTSPTRLLLGTPAPTPTRPFTWGEVKSFYR